MAFCGNCGTKVGDNVKFCPNCGKGMETGGSAPAASGTTASGKKDAEENKTMAILAYILFFIPLITGDHNKSPFVKYHANQGLVLFIAIVAYSIAYAILAAILSAILLAIGAWALLGIVNLVLGLTWIIPIIFCILGIVNAVKGVMKPLPLIGGIKILK